MELVNYTPWPHLMFERGDAEDRRFMVLVFQGTFAFEDGGLVPLEKQPPVLPNDVYFGDPASASMERAGAVATRKARSDISVLALARSAEPRPKWPVRLRVGQLSHQLEVRGRYHWWCDPDEGWRLTKPETCRRVPIAYELAFGGRHLIDEELVQEERNPLGTGFLPDGLEGTRAIPAPQVVSVDEPEHEPGKRYPPKGWAPIPGYFAPRAACVGTTDEAWKSEQWPKPPQDFSDAFYQSAHPDLVYPGYLRGDEPIRIEGVTVSEEPIEARLPGFAVFALLRLNTGRMLVQSAVLDTLHIDVRAPEPRLHRAYLTWRLVVPKTDGVRRLEGRMVPLSEVGKAGVHPPAAP